MIVFLALFLLVSPLIIKGNLFVFAQDSEDDPPNVQSDLSFDMENTTVAPEAATATQSETIVSQAYDNSGTGQVNQIQDGVSDEEASQPEDTASDGN